MTRKRSPEIDPGHDELELIEAMLNDKYVNHSLDKLIKGVQIIRVQDPENYGEYPGIRLYSGGWLGSFIAEEVDEDGDFIDSFGKTITIEIFAMENQEAKYNGKIYEGTRILTLVRDILIRVFSEQLDYPFKGDEKVKEEFDDIQIDYIELENEMWITDHLGQPDSFALVLHLVVSYEKKRR